MLIVLNILVYSSLDLLLLILRDNRVCEIVKYIILGIIENKIIYRGWA